MKERFEGPEGNRRLKDALLEQRVVAGNIALAAELADCVELIEVGKDDVLIEQEAEDNSMYFIIAGSFRIVINAKQVSVRRTNNHVGEMAAIEPSQRRAASVVADEA